ncbi:MAG: ATP-binding protein [Deltaproteobacteria bacterium]|nr:ATP-binding protein [Deltaproteobacteria bacterium]
MTMAKKVVLGEVLADFHARTLPPLTTRDIAFEILPTKILTLTGVRRSGKTYCLYQLMHRLLAEGVPKENLVWVNFEDERLVPMMAAELGLILEVYFERYPEKQRERIYLFLDEIQNVEGWERFARRVHESENVQLFLTGSSAKLLSREIATSLRGRTLNYEIFPFTFAEYLRHRGIPPNARSRAEKTALRNASAAYLDRGGFPETVTASETAWRMILQEYVNLIIFRDVVERHGVRNQALIKYLVKCLLRQIAAPMTVHKLYRDLRSQGYTVGKDTLHCYLSYFEEAYSFFTVPIFSESVRMQEVNYRKLYTVDTGLTNAVVAGLSERRGQMLENSVFLHLCRLPGRGLFYYRNQRGAEIDFVILQRGRVTDVIQVTEHLDNASSAEQVVDDLWRAMEELRCAEAVIVTRDTEKELRKARKVIRVIPLWKWTLELSGAIR